MRNFIIINFKRLIIFIFLWTTLILFKNFFTHNLVFLNFELLSSSMLYYNIFITFYCCLFFLNTYKKNLYFSFFLYFFFIVLAMSVLLTTKNLILFFLSYEAIMLPSCVLIYYSSANIRSKFITMYYLLWTQGGSFVFFLVLCFLIPKQNDFNFINITFQNKTLISLFLFYSFGVKIPVWPLHFWLTKTHVEVNTSFSILLSGVLVKIALLGMYKFIYFFYNNYFFVLVATIGMLDISFKISQQVDLKKIVAYCTIFEMNFLVINLFFIDFNKINILFMFSVIHTTFSNTFFSISEFLYKRYNTRNLYLIPSMKKNCPYFFFITIMSSIMFNGIPFTVKMSVEVNMIICSFNTDIMLAIIFFMTNLFFLMSFNYLLSFVMFFNSTKKLSVDLSKKEILFLTIPLTLLWLI